MGRAPAEIKERYLELAKKFRTHFVDPHEQSPGVESQLVPENYSDLADSIVRHYLKLMEEAKHDREVNASRNRRAKSALMSGDNDLIGTAFGVEMLVIDNPQQAFFAFTQLIYQMAFGPGNVYEYEGDDVADDEDLEDDTYDEDQS